MPSVSFLSEFSVYASQGRSLPGPRIDSEGVADTIGVTAAAGLEMVPRDRIELSTPAFSGQEESEQDQIDKIKTQCKE